ncbi:hypothetical protein HGO38_24530 [Rhizobium sp. CG5]|uniref:hypothetical protein n=1 Tax=Rhizobium sp. CG5 TaxID=2726076 RepID=UPI002033BED2|nr:hypothetical protein [Rhizobium sp. CG5]MCM2476616.1 hypothetical protein [Rhizobium sp. CG5]
MELLVWGIFYLVSAPIIFSPTILYLWAIPRVVRYAAGFSPVAAGGILTAYVVVPCILWGFAYISAKNAQDAYQARIDALPKVAVSELQPELAIVTKEKVVLAELDPDPSGCPPPLSPRQPRQQLTQMPARYLLLDTDSDIPLGRSGKATTAGEGPFQLTLVENGKSSLVAFHYVPFNPKPMFPPIFTLHGWFHLPNTINTTQVRANVVDFVRHATGRCIEY